MSISVRCEAAPVNDGWVYSGSTSMPVDAIVAGSTGDTPLYLCRAHYGNTLQPGFALANGSVCQFSYGGLALTATQFDWYVPAWIAAISALVGPFQILKENQGGWPINGVVAGLDSDGTPLYLCTAYFADGMQPGKARQDRDACDVTWGGGEHYVSFNLLTAAYLVTQTGGSDPTCASGLDPLCTAHINPVPAGIDGDGATLWACVAYLPDGAGVIPGKTKLAWGRSCSYPSNGVDAWGSGAVLTDGMIPQPPKQ